MIRTAFLCSLRVRYSLVVQFVSSHGKVDEGAKQVLNFWGGGFSQDRLKHRSHESLKGFVRISEEKFDTLTSRCSCAEVTCHAMHGFIVLDEAKTVMSPGLNCRVAENWKID